MLWKSLICAERLQHTHTLRWTSLNCQLSTVLVCFISCLRLNGLKSRQHNQSLCWRRDIHCWANWDPPGQMWWWQACPGPQCSKHLSISILSFSFSPSRWLRYFHQSFLREWLTNAVPTTEPTPAMVAALSSSGNLFSKLKYKQRGGKTAHRATPPTLHSVFTGPFFSPLPRYLFQATCPCKISGFSKSFLTIWLRWPLLQVEDLSNEKKIRRRRNFSPSLRLGQLFHVPFVQRSSYIFTNCLVRWWCTDDYTLPMMHWCWYTDDMHWC